VTAKLSGPFDTASQRQVVPTRTMVMPLDNPSRRPHCASALVRRAVTRRERLTEIAGEETMPLDQLLALTAIGLAPVTCVLATLLFTARRRAQRAEALVQQIAIALAARGSAGTDLAPALDAIALEVERIGEGQRFVTRLLEDRARRDPAAEAQSRVSTPH
jgi:hypothetical protein